jgi:hypothetical protein
MRELKKFSRKKLFHHQNQIIRTVKSLVSSINSITINVKTFKLINKIKCLLVEKIYLV